MNSDLLNSISKIDDHRSLKKASYAVVDPDQTISQLLDIIETGVHPDIKKYAYVLSHIIESNPDRIDEYIPKLVSILSSNKMASIKRDLLRALQSCKIPTTTSGLLVSICFDYLVGKEPTAVKVFAMTTISNQCLEHPDLSRELRIVVEELMKYGTPGIHSRGKRVINCLDKIDRKK